MVDGRGGNQPPKRPAAVSGPGALSRRTDGGPGGKTPLPKVASGGAYGERKAAEEQQAAAPMAGGGSGAPAGGGGSPAGPPPGGAPGGDMFRPSEVPGGPVGGDGAGSPAQMLRENPQIALRAMYSKFPTPAIAALLRRMGTNG